MAENKDSGDKTEKATPKRLLDARKKGDVAKSKDITNTIILIMAVVAMWQFSDFLTKDFKNLMTQALSLQHESLDYQIKVLGGAKDGTFKSRSRIKANVLYGQFVRASEVGA